MKKLTFPLVDTHVHLWDPGYLTYDWLGSLPALNRKFTLSEFNEHSAGINVGSMVFVQCDAAVNEGLKEAEWIQELSRSEPRLKAAVAYARLEKGDAVKEDLQRLATLPMVKGIRRLLEPEQDGFGLQRSFIDGLNALTEFNLSFDICIQQHQLGSTIEMIKQCPKVSFMLDHIAKPDIRNGVIEPWSRLIRDVADLPNVTCKISGMVTEANLESWTCEELRPYVDAVIESFGIDRVAFGGDWPVSTLTTTYPAWVETLYSLVESYSEDELRKIFSINGSRFYRIP